VTEYRPVPLAYEREFYDHRATEGWNAIARRPLPPLPLVNMARKRYA
jgi:hypothetical protein